MGIKTLIERLNQYSQSLIAYKLGADFADACMDAAAALSTLQAENEKLKDQLYDGEGVNLVNYWMQQAKIEENGHRNCQAENEQLRSDLRRLQTERDTLLAANQHLLAERDADRKED